MYIYIYIYIYICSSFLCLSSLALVAARPLTVSPCGPTVLYDTRTSLRRRPTIPLYDIVYY